MKFVWTETKNLNQELIFKYKITKPCNGIVICAVDFYRVFIDGKFVSYGPERAPQGFSRKRKISFPYDVKEITIKVLSYGIPTYTCAFQSPFFGAEIYDGNTLVDDTFSFDCVSDNKRITKVPKYSYQRGFLEVYDYSFDGYSSIVTKEVESPIILDSIGDFCNYTEEKASFVKTGVFKSFDDVQQLWWENSTMDVIGNPTYKVETDMINLINGYNSYDFKLKTVKTGFIKLNVKTDCETKLFFVFDEILPDNKWIFRRSCCNDYIQWKLPKGNFELISSEPYTFQFIKILTSKEVKVEASVILLQNDNVNTVFQMENGVCKDIFYSALNTYRQNALDIFMDCPGRERAGYLCDSYFTSMAEFFYTGQNKIEKNFLENYLLVDTGDSETFMPAMCFPSNTEKTFIPNWAMWLVLEFAEYYKRTSDSQLINSAKEKVYKIIKYFDKYLNEYGLIEDLDGWVFVEWSICNNQEYVQGVNFPTNMLYSKMLFTAGNLYNDESLIKRSFAVKKIINDIAFDGEFYVDNATRQNGVLIPEKTHITETCQYYALFTGVADDHNYSERIIKDFGPLNELSDEMVRSNVFIGYYLRLLILREKKLYDKIIEEIIKICLPMSELTGTLWENNMPTASCNHGFASVVAVLLAESLTNKAK